MKEKAELDRNLAVGEKNLAVRVFDIYTPVFEN
jgi:hypothetical protein